MDNTTLMVMVVVAVLVVLAVVWMVMQQRRRAHLKDRFGPEYDQALRQHPDARAAERELLDRERRVASVRHQAADARRRRALLGGLAA